MWRFISQSSREEDDRLIQAKKRVEMRNKTSNPRVHTLWIQLLKGETKHKMARREMSGCEKHATTKDRPKPWIPLKISDGAAT